MIAIPKDGSLLCPPYLTFVRSQKCFFCPLAPPVQAHHWPRRSSGVTRDDCTIPVCPWCHKRCHGEVVVIRAVRYHPISTAEQDAAVPIVRARFLNEAPVKDVVAYFHALLHWRANRMELVPA